MATRLMTVISVTIIGVVHEDDDYKTDGGDEYVYGGHKESRLG